MTIYATSNLMAPPAGPAAIVDVDITAGTYSSIVGYYQGFAGSIVTNNSDLPGSATFFITADQISSAYFWFVGDYTTELAGTKVYVDDVLFDPGGSNVWYYYASTYTAYGQSPSTFPSAYGFVDGNSYNIKVY